ncbi:electron transport complex subunit RsxC [bacterium]|nr:electron transport complex subunit RsxC [bacterium]
MGLRTFSGGVHPPASKALTKEAAISEARLPERVVIPLRQSLGAPATPCVSVGDDVKVGQKIGEPGGFVSVPVHASISGKIAAVGRFPHPSGGEDTAIVIEGDGADTWDESIRERADVASMSPDEIREAVKEAGLVGLGGAAFPTHVKLSPPEAKPINTIILNGAECEPWLTADHRLMLERPTEILEGLVLIMRTVGADRGIVGIESNKLDAVKTMREAVKAVREKLPEGATLNVTPVQVKYPQGAEKQLIDALLRRKVPAGGLPMDVGVVVQNVGTSLAVYEACRFGRPLVKRVMTLTGTPVRNPGNFMARVGTLLTELVDQAGGLSGEIGKIISGGPMMGIAQFTLDIPVVKGMSGVLLLTPEQVDDRQPEPCLRCGACVHVCPMKLVPVTVEKLVMNEKIPEAIDMGLNDCIECGSCAYVCPSKRRLVHYFKFGKYLAAQARKKEADREAAGKGTSEN